MFRISYISFRQRKGKVKDKDKYWQHIDYIYINREAQTFIQHALQSLSVIAKFSQLPGILTRPNHIASCVIHIYAGLISPRTRALSKKSYNIIRQDQ